MKYNCNPKQLKGIFSNLTAGTFPPNGNLKGTILLAGLQNQNIWNGKKIRSGGGIRPNDRGTLTNLIAKQYELFNADIYRKICPIDGKEAFALDYKKDPLAFFVVDYIREVQTNFYLGVATIRPFENVALVYFLLEKV